MMTAGTLVEDHSVVVLRDDDDVRSAVRAMDSNRIGSVLVADEKGDCHGILTDRDLVYALLLGKEGAETKLGDLVSEILLCVEPDEPLESVVEKMKDFGVRRIPVIDFRNGRRKAVGLISVDDLIVRKAISTDDLAEILISQTVGPVRRPPEERRRGERRRHSYNRFIGEFALVSRLPRDKAEKAVEKLLASLCARVTSNERFDFASQLPARLREILLEEAPGPDRSVTAEAIVSGVSKVTGEDPERAREVVRQFWAFVGRYVSRGELEDMMSQLPRDIGHLLVNECKTGA